MLRFVLAFKMSQICSWSSNYVNNNRFIYINCVVNIYHCVQNRAFCTPLKNIYIASVKFPFKAQIEKG